MRNRRLRQLHPLLDIEGAESGPLVDGASAFFRQRAQNSTASRVGDGVEETVKIGIGVCHDHEE